MVGTKGAFEPETKKRFYLFSPEELKVKILEINFGLQSNQINRLPSLSYFPWQQQE